MPLDYKKLGFKCGIEIHQQLETHKLFCNCPSLVNDGHKADVFFERKFRAVAGETGKVDAAAQFEKSKDKIYKYEACSSSSCLVEMDEEPPHEVNMDALKTVLEAAKMLNCKIVDNIQFMRKTVIDGSNVSGFQRTALVGFDGSVETSKGKVAIDTICLEEEAAKKLEETKGYTKFRLDRLGIALIEVATDASIKDSEHAKEVASKIGMILRSTGKVKRGIGTIRQDVNVSIKGKSRVEIKGFQELKSIPKIIENEVKRQMNLKESYKEVRKAESDGTTIFLRPMPGADRMYPETDIPPIKITNKLLNEIKIPELLDEKALRYAKEFQLESDLAKELVKAGINFEDYAKNFKNINNNFIATVLISFPKEIKTRYGLDCKKITNNHYKIILKYLNDNIIPKDTVMNLLIDSAKGKKLDVSKYKQFSDDQLKKEIKKIIDANPNAPIGGLMGDIMKKFQGKVDGKKAMMILKSMR
ncbi:MAG: Glu-tRNA(Gln) amidotransferase subunit GatE [Nanoarchaeota archaeon]|nr:Glu-tRNA(Gln) amidotransferase subunit GatE [Nanoarchaeota archaeon]